MLTTGWKLITFFAVDHNKFLDISPHGVLSPNFEGIIQMYKNFFEAPLTWIFHKV